MTDQCIKGVKPGIKPTKLQSRPVNFFFQVTLLYTEMTECRMEVGCSLVGEKAKEQTNKPQLITDCETEWTKVKMKNNKDLYLSLFYLPHRNMKVITNLDLSLKRLSESNKSKHILLARDFNCPDIDWNTLTIRPNAPDREVQQSLIELSIEHGLSQVHNQPKSQDNVLDLVFTDKPSLIKKLSKHSRN